jgi:hypothetical protein
MSLRMADKKDVPDKENKGQKFFHHDVWQWEFRPKPLSETKKDILTF